jgi:hypothetical protein
MKTNAATKRKILQLIRAGVKQKEVARIIGCSVDTIVKVRKAAGLTLWRPLTPEVEAEVLALLRQGIGQKRTATLTRVPETRVREVMKKNQIVHPEGGVRLPRESIVAAIFAKEDFCNKIAKRHGVAPTTVQRIAHEVLGPGPLSKKYPLESIWPQIQKFVQERPMPTTFRGSAFPLTGEPAEVLGAQQAVSLVELVIRDKGLPPDPVAFSEELALAYERNIRSIYPQWWDALLPADQSIVRHTIAIELMTALNEVFASIVMLERLAELEALAAK